MSEDLFISEEKSIARTKFSSASRLSPLPPNKKKYGLSITISWGNKLRLMPTLALPFTWVPEGRRKRARLRETWRKIERDGGGGMKERGSKTRSKAEIVALKQNSLDMKNEQLNSRLRRTGQ